MLGISTQPAGQSYPPTATVRAASNHHRDRRALAQDLLDHRVEVGLVAALDLGAEPIGDLRVAGEPLERPRERRRGRLLARHQHRDQLVADLAVGHRRAVGAAGLDQEREQVVAEVPRAGGAALLDLAVDELVDSASTRISRAYGLSPPSSRRNAGSRVNGTRRGPSSGRRARAGGRASGRRRPERDLARSSRRRSPPSPAAGEGAPERPARGAALDRPAISSSKRATWLRRKPAASAAVAEVLVAVEDEDRVEPTTGRKSPLASPSAARGVAAGRSRESRRGRDEDRALVGSEAGGEDRPVAPAAPLHERDRAAEPGERLAQVWARGRRQAGSVDRRCSWPRSNRQSRDSGTDVGVIAQFAERFFRLTRPAIDRVPK